MPKRKGMASVSALRLLIVVAGNGVLQSRRLPHLLRRQLALQEGSRSAIRQQRLRSVASEPARLPVLLHLLRPLPLADSPSASQLPRTPNRLARPLPLPRRLRSVDFHLERSLLSRRRRRPRLPLQLRLRSLHSAGSRSVRRTASLPPQRPRRQLLQQPSLHLPVHLLRLPSPLAGFLSELRRRRQRRLSGYHLPRDRPPLLLRPPSRVLLRALGRRSRSRLTLARSRTTPRSAA